MDSLLTGLQPPRVYSHEEPQRDTPPTNKPGERFCVYCGSTFKPRHEYDIHCPTCWKAMHG